MLAAGKQFQPVAGIGLMALLMAVWLLLECSRSAPDSFPETASQKYRLIDSESEVGVGTWTSQGGRSTLTLRDGKGIPRLILQADQTEGGRMSIQDANGQWHYYPAPAPE
jgi:hypothetical protein